MMLTRAHPGVLAPGATRWRLAACAFALLPLCAVGQEVEALKRRVSELEQLVVSQRDEFSSKLAELEKRLDEQPRDEKTSEISEKVEEVSRKVSSLGQLLRRPVEGSSTPTADIFSALHGGLVFTGLFRSRFEAKRNTLDFNGSGSSGIDDSGIRFNGRFRLGFGAVLNADPDGTGEQITALTEFQSVGTYANNTFLGLPSAAGVTVPVQFNIFVEPFEVVNLYQGYMSFQRLLDKTINVKIGRQEIVFGNEMILGNNSFQEGTVHDALLFQWKPCDPWRLSAFYSKEAGPDLSLGSSKADFDEDEMAAAYVEYEPEDQQYKLEAYAAYFNARSAGQDTFVTGSTAYMFDGAYRPPIFGQFWTIGARAFVTDIRLCKDVLTVNGELAWQNGREALNGLLQEDSRDVGGLCGELLVNYRFNPSSDGLRPIATLGYYYAQGGDDITGGDVGFQPLFINRHFETTLRGERNDIYKPYYPGGGRYGNMDELPLFNVHIMKAALSVALSEKIEVGAGFLWAITADDEGYGTGTFGQEADLFGSYVYNDHVQFSANLSFFFPGKTAVGLSNLLFFDPADPSNHADNDLAMAFYLQALIQF
jgi:hypothetical protein